MDIDMSALRLLEREREIPLDLLIPTIEQALLVAYHKSPGAFEKARAELDRKSGHVTIWAVEIDDDGAPIGEFEDTPAGFGRIAASTARQIILQRLRDVEDDNILGEFKGREGELVAGLIQQGNNPHMIQVNLGAVEALLPPPEQVPGEKYTTATGSAPWSLMSTAAPKARPSRCPGRTRASSGSSSNWRSRRSRTARWRSSPWHAKPVTGPRSPSRPTPRASTPRVPASAKWVHASAPS